MTRTLFIIAILLTAPALAQEAAPPPADTPTRSVYADLGAAQAVRAGNQLLLANDPAGALTAYQHARTIEPAAHEIDFVEGLAHYTMEDYEAARASFENAATAKNDALVDDAIYSVGTTYHAEALKQTENPQEAIASLEKAMQRYQTVLGNRPDHPAANDANFKAASMWRTLKQQMEQQQQEQQQNEDGEKNEEQESQDQEKQQSDQQQEQEKNEDQQQQQSQDQEQESDQQQQDQQQSEEQEQQQSEQEQKEQQEQQAQKSEEDSREDAERKLRELMQALRDRQKRKPQRVERVQVAPADKDW